jgi:hypothetical protein
MPELVARVPFKLGFPSNPPSIVLTLIVLSISIWAIYRALKTPNESFAGIGKSKARWIVYLAIATVLQPIGFLFSLYFLWSVRPRLLSQS